MNAMRNRFVFTVLLILPVALATQANADQAPVNVLFLIVDDLNTWLLTDPHRYTGKVIAPNIQRLARQGVLFHNAYTASPLCVPSRTAFLSGVAPWKSGVYQNQAAVMESTALQGVPSLFTTFKNNGYFIASIGKVSHGYKTGAEYDVSMGHKRTPPPPGAPLNGIARSAGGKLTERDWGPTHLDESMMSEKLLADKAIEVLRQKHAKPFFIACGLFHPHYPWYAPQKYFDMYPLEKLMPPLVPDNRSPQEDYVIGNRGWHSAFQDFSLQDQREFLRSYYAGTSFTDAQIGRVMDELDRQDLWKDTVVIFVGDHGYNLGEYDWWNKAVLMEDSARIPMIVVVEGVTE